MSRVFYVSIHAPARGATHSRLSGKQPHRVSIHAPARGATLTGKAADSETVSIHAPARGATPRLDAQIGELIKFQSTHPRGVRPGENILMAVIGSFNPRTREGCDTSSSALQWQNCSFNPRTREGCDRDVCGVGGDNLVSIHAPARGATPRL